MACYVRHLDEVLDALGIENTKEGRKKLDLLIKEKLNMQEAHCPEVWNKIKEISNSGADMLKLVDLLKD
ncbi:MAG: hypothetical protein C4562_00305 [Actinobacteria bacterium]|nr:MAG: hypothetical protein C4562_00305 [Actinomycetota bacterium]